MGNIDNVFKFYKKLIFEIKNMRLIRILLIINYKPIKMKNLFFFIYG